VRRRRRTDAALAHAAHLNTSFAHFLLFVDEVRRPLAPASSSLGLAHAPLARPQFKLIEKKELAPLAELNASILSR